MENVNQDNNFFENANFVCFSTLSCGLNSLMFHNLLGVIDLYRHMSYCRERFRESVSGFEFINKLCYWITLQWYHTSKTKSLSVCYVREILINEKIPQQIKSKPCV